MMFGAFMLQWLEFPEMLFEMNEYWSEERYGFHQKRLSGFPGLPLQTYEFEYLTRVSFFRKL